LEESLLGFEREIVHLDGHKVRIKNEADQIMQPDQWLIIKNEGMPVKSMYRMMGDLHVKCKVKLPNKLSA
jgi:DnaJ-class molecular chaperone